MAEPSDQPDQPSFLTGIINEIFSSYLNIALIGLIEFLLYKIVRSSTDTGASKSAPPKTKLPRLRKDFTVQELKAFDGNQPDGRVLVAVNESVYDATKGKRFYGPGGPYAAFGGRDALRGLATFQVVSSDKDGYDDLSDLSTMEMDSVREWELQFKGLQTYNFAKEVNFSTNTCPECFAICTRTAPDVHRLYLTFANELSDEETLRNVKMVNKRARHRVSEVEATLSDLRQKVFNDLEADIVKLNAQHSRRKQQQIIDLKEQIQQRRGVQANFVEAKSWESIHKILTGSTNDVEEDLKSVKSERNLAKMVVLLQRDLRTAEDKRKAFRIVLRASQDENEKLDSENRLVLFKFTLYVFTPYISELYTVQIELSEKRDILKTRNFILWDNVLNSQITLGVEKSKDRGDKNDD